MEQLCEKIYIYIIVKFVKFYLTFEMFVWLRGNNWRKNSFGRDIKKIEWKFHEFPFTDIEKQSGSAIVRVEGRMKIDRRSLEGTSFPCQGESDIRDDLMSIGGGKTSLSRIYFISTFIARNCALYSAGIGESSTTLSTPWILFSSRTRNDHDSAVERKIVKFHWTVPRSSLSLGKVTIVIRGLT